MLQWWRRRNRARRERVAALVAEETRGIVRSGPFAGLRYPIADAAGSALAPKLIGSYEREIHGFIEKAITRAPPRILNIGAGEGYYAVGMARRLVRADVYAFESDAKGRSLCESLARANQVSERVHVRGTCSRADLDALTRQPALIICDIEGGERELLDPVSAHGLVDCEIIAELHSGRGLDIAGEMRERFGETHTVTMARYEGRDASEAVGLNGLSRPERRIALDERRRHGLEWIHLVPFDEFLRGEASRRHLQE